MSLRIGLKTLGCRLNQMETDALAAKLLNKGYEVQQTDSQADVVIVNSCTVTGQSDQKSRHLVHHALKGVQGRMVILTGCMASHQKEKLQQQFPNVYVVDNAHKSAIPQLVEAHARGELLDLDRVSASVFDYDAPLATFHTRAMVKIQDGCNNFCTFCIIPTVRGKAVSRPVEEVLTQVRALVQAGYRELVLTGVNISRYRHGEVNFTGLLQRILELDGDFRVRISSIEPDRWDDSFYRLLQHPRMTRHLHLCLQSGSDRILLQMRRMYTTRQFLHIADALRSIDPLFNLTTDLITGFPGETISDFDQSIEMIQRVQFGHVHAFPYSRRDHTRAAELPNQIGEQEKNRRNKVAIECADEVQRLYRSRLVGVPQTVLIERSSDAGFISGYGQYYVPVTATQKGVSTNSWVQLLPGGIDPQGALTQE